MSRNQQFESELLDLLEKYDMRSEGVIKELKVIIDEESYPKIESTIAHDLNNE